jgi:acyl carrier protein
MVNKQQVLEQMARFLGRPGERFADDSLLTDLVSDSFVLVEMAISFQEEFGVQFGHEELRGVKTVGDLGRLVESISGAS